MARCQVCGRHPAKYMEFKAHQGFVFFRREMELAGILCRDCGMQAYLAARGATLRGMWFSPGSLLFGTVRSLWDSVKLLDLPDEVRDEPWVFHVVACPYCHRKNASLAGPATCATCGRAFAVGSCPACGTVHVITDARLAESASISCCKCAKVSSGAGCIRNWTALLLARALAEVSASVASAGGAVRNEGAAVFQDAIEAVFTFTEPTREYLRTYFDRCLAGQSLGLWKTFRENAKPEVLRLLLSVAISTARADGEIDDAETTALREIAAGLGFDPDALLEYLARETGQVSRKTTWWKTLGLSQDATFDEVTAAYRRLARECHPDLWMTADKRTRATTTDRMKALNAAFEQAKRAAQVESPPVVSGSESKEGTPEPSVGPREATVDLEARDGVERVEAEPSKPEDERPNDDAGDAEPQDIPGASRETDSDRGEGILSEQTTASYRDVLSSEPPRAVPGGMPERRSKRQVFTPWVVGVSILAGVLLFPVIAILLSVHNWRLASTDAVSHPEVPREPAGTQAVVGRVGPEPTTQEHAKLSEPGVFHVPEQKRGEDNPFRAPEKRRPTVQTGPITTDEESPSKPPAPVEVASPDAAVYNLPLPRHIYVPVPSREPEVSKEGIKASMKYYQRRAKLRALTVPAVPGTPSLSAQEHVGLGIDLVKERRLEAAISAFDEAIQLDSRCARAYHNRGVTQIIRGELDRAIQDFDKALRINPDYPEAYANRGLAYEKKGDKAKAKQDYSKAEQLGMSIGPRD